MGNGFLKVAVKVNIKKQINILAAVNGKDISVFVGELVEAAWEADKLAGKVTDAMISTAPGVIDAQGLLDADVADLKASWEVSHRMEA